MSRLGAYVLYLTGLDWKGRPARREDAIAAEQSYTFADERNELLDRDQKRDGYVPDPVTAIKIAIAV